MHRVLALDNGVVIVADPFASPLAAVVVAVGVGSLYEDGDKRGITHLLEHVMFRVPGFDVDEAVESLGGSNNAYTQRDAIMITLEGLAASAGGLVELAHRLYVNEKYAEEDVERERAAVLSELRQSRENPSDRVGELAVKALFGDSDWGAPVGGTPETVESIELRDLLEHKRKWFVGGNTLVVLSGGFSEEAMEKAARLFGGLEGGRPQRRTPTWAEGPKRLIEERDVDGVYYAKAVRVAVDNAAAVYPLLSAASIHLEAGTKSVLFNVVRSTGIAYSYYVDFDVVGDVGYLAVVVESARGLEEVRKAVEDALRPRRPPPYRLSFFKYLWESSWRSPVNRAVTLAEFYLKGGRPQEAERVFWSAAVAGTAWLEGRIIDVAEAYLLPEKI